MGDDTTHPRQLSTTPVWLVITLLVAVLMGSVAVVGGVDSPAEVTESTVDTGDGIAFAENPESVDGAVSDDLEFVPVESVASRMIGLWSGSAQDEPTAEFDWEPETALPNEEITFDASDSTGNIDSYHWDFGDDSDPTWERTPETSHSYSEPGTYTVTLTVSDDTTQETDSVERELTVADRPTADFEWEPDEPMEGESVTFDASDSASPDGEIVSYEWNFGDGDSETTSDPEIEHAYDETGEVRVTLTVVDEFGQEARDARSLTVRTPDPPTAVYDHPDDPVAGTEIEFDASDSDSPDGEIVDYRWDFTLDGEVDVDGESPEASWTYEESGVVAPELVVEDEFGQTAPFQMEIEIRDPDPPTAALSHDPTEPTVGEQVTFDASDSDSPDGEIVEYRWDLTMDGETDETTAEPAATHTYDEADDYRVRVEVEDEFGQTATGYDQVDVQEPDGPSAAFDWDPEEPMVDQAVTFDASDSHSPDGEIDSYEWTFGDGTDETTSDPEIEHVYDDAGDVRVTLTVEDEFGQRDSASESVTVVEPDGPTAVFDWEPDTPEEGEEITFDASDSESPDGEIVDYRWDLTQDGEFDVEDGSPETSWTYEESGWVGPVLEVEDEFGQTAQFQPEIEVREPDDPTATLSHEPTQPEEGETVTFDASDSESPNGEITEYRWDLTGDGTVDETTAEPEIEHVYDDVGVQEVTLEVRDEVDRTATTSAEFRVTAAEPAEPTAAFDWTPDVPEEGETVTLDASDSDSPNGDIVEYRWQFDDGTTETTSDPELAHAFDESGVYAAELEVEDEAGQTARTAAELQVDEADLAEPTAAFDWDPREPEEGGDVTFDASDSHSPNGEITEYRWDVTGDGTVDETTSDPVLTYSYDDEANRTVTLTVVDEANATASAEEELVVAAASSGPLPDPSPSVIALTIAGLAALGGSAWYVSSGGSGSGSGRPTPPPKLPSSGDEDPEPYETGVLEIHPDETTATASVGFEPGLITVTATVLDGGSSERTAGIGRGVASPGEDGVEQFAHTAADDAETTERGTVTTRDGAVFELVCHDDRSLGRLRGEVVDVDDDGFSIELRTLGGADRRPVRVLYRAFAAEADLECEIGQFETPTEPGRQVVDLGVDASAIELVASTAVGGSDERWTTDRTVGLSAGAASDREGLEQVADADFTWPGRANHTGASCDVDRALAIAYHDGDRVAGHTSASVDALGERLELNYDRVYSGPGKIDPVGRHRISYAAVETETLTPTVGVVELPEPGEEVAVDCGFEPGLVDVTTRRAPALGHDRASGAEAVPFEATRGTAIVRDGDLTQYALDGAPEGEGVETADGSVEGELERGELPVQTDDRVAVADGGSDSDEDEEPTATATAVAADLDADGTSVAADSLDAETVADALDAETVADALDGEAGDGSADGESSDGSDDGQTGEDWEDDADDESTVTPPAPGDGESNLAGSDTTPDVGSSPSGSEDASGESDHGGADSTAAGDEPAAPLTALDRVALTSAIDDDGVVVGRDALQVAQTSADGFTLRTEGYRVYDHDPSTERRTYVCYRAWPVDGGDADAEESTK